MTTERDEIDAFIETTYWGNRGSYPVLAGTLQQLIPVQGEVDNSDQNPSLELFRVAQNFYYDIYNNGLCNKEVLEDASGRTFISIFMVRPAKYYIHSGDFELEFYQKVEAVMDQIILAAGKEQGLI